MNNWIKLNFLFFICADCLSLAEELMRKLISKRTNQIEPFKCL